MKYYKQDNVHIIECYTDEFSIELVSKKKKDVRYENYTNSNFFGSYGEQGENFTLPAGHLLADYKSSGKFLEYYLNERGKFINNKEKVIFDSYNWKFQNQFYQKALTCLIVEDNKPYFNEIKTVSEKYNYCISGAPVIRNGKQCNWTNDVVKQGYDGGPFYATKHIFVGMKQNDDRIYILGWKSSKGNLISSGEAYNKFKPMGFYNVIKLDGGGSYHFVVNGEIKDTMSENRRINAIFKITPRKEIINDDVSPWAKDAWDKAVRKGIISNDNPKGSITREMLMFMEDKLGNL